MDDSLANKLGAAVRAAREQRGLTRAEAAEAIDISMDFLGRIERGTTLPSVETLARLVSTVGVRFDDVAVPDSATATKHRSSGPRDLLIARIERLLPRLPLRALRAISDLTVQLTKVSPSSSSRDR